MINYAQQAMRLKIIKIVMPDCTSLILINAFLL